MNLDSGHEVTYLDDEELAKMKKDFGSFVEGGMVRLTPGRWMFTAKFLKFANKIHDFKFRQTDVVVETYAKCGTTWTQEIIWTMRNNPNLDHPRADRHILTRVPFIEYDMVMPSLDPDTPPKRNYHLDAFREMCPGKNLEDGLTFQLSESIPDPRTIKTHLPLSLMPPSMLDKAKVVYVARNPKDVVISYHHHCKIAEILDFVGSFEEFVQYFVDGDILYGPYWLHLKEAWERRNHPNLHIIFYEDMKANPLKEIKELNTFLDTNLTETQMENIAKYTSFAEMKTRSERATREASSKSPAPLEVSERKMQKQDYIKKEGGFFRKGEVGDWKNKLTPEMDDKMNRWIEEHLSDFGIDFKYGI